MKALVNYINGRNLNIVFDNHVRLEHNSFLKWFKLNLHYFEDELDFDFYSSDVFDLNLTFVFESESIVIIQNKGVQIGALQLIPLNHIKL